MTTSKDFFTRNLDHYLTTELSRKDYFFDFMKNATKRSSLLDIGGGNGLFASAAKAILPDLRVTVVDPCAKLMERIDDKEIERVEGELPARLNVSGPFDIIHISLVLHHITGSSVTESQRLLTMCLDNIHAVLGDEGYLLLEELYYESSLKPETSRNLIFLMLKLHVWIPGEDFVPGLVVCFYTRNELEAALKNSGFEIIDRRDIPWLKGIKTSLLLLRDWGITQFVCKKTKGFSSCAKTPELTSKPRDTGLN